MKTLSRLQSTEGLTGTRRTTFKVTQPPWQVEVTSWQKALLPELLQSLPEQLTQERKVEPVLPLGLSPRIHIASFLHYLIVHID